MMYARKIKLIHGKQTTNNLLEIDEIYVDGCDNPGFFKKAALHDYLTDHPDTISVAISPYPKLKPMISINREKYVRSEPDAYQKDNLLKLPVE